MKRFTWWRMEQDAHHLSRALCGAFCSILHHVKRFMSQPPNFCFVSKPKGPYKTGPISSTRYKMERPRRGCVNLPYLAGTKKRPVKKGPYYLISPSK